MPNMERLKTLIRELVEEELEEVSTAAAAGPYMSPKAFSSPSHPEPKAHKKKRTAVSGYTTVSDEDGDGDGGLNENRYTEFKRNPLPTHRKIGMAISEMNKALTEAERILNMSARLKEESNLKSDQMWNRTNKTLMKMEVRLLTAVKRIREMRS